MTASADEAKAPPGAETTRATAASSGTSMKALGRRIAKMSSYVFLSSIVLKFLSVAQSIMIIRILGRADFGLLSIVGYVVSIFGLVAGLGMPIGFVRLLSDAHVREREKTAELETTYLWLTVMSTAIAAAALLVSTPLLTHDVYGDSRLIILFPLTAIGLGIAVPSGMISLVLQAHQRIPTMVKLSFLFAAIGIPLSLAFAYLWRVEGYVLSGIVGGLISFSAYAVLFRKGIRRRLGRITVFSRSNAKELLTLGTPTMLAHAVAIVGTWIGITLLALTHGFESVGLFAVADGVAGFVLFVQSAVTVPFIPAATEEYTKGVERLRLATYHTSKYLIIIVFPLCLMATLFGREIVTFLYTADFSSANLALGYMSAVYLLLSYAAPIGFVYYALKLMRRMVILNLIWFTMFVVGVILMVPSGSFGGLALATLVVYLIHMHFGLLLIRDKYDISAVYKLLLVTECLAVGLACLAFLMADARLIVRLGLSVVILGIYPAVLRYGVLNDRDVAFLNSLVAGIIAKLRGTPPATVEQGFMPREGFYETFHEKTQAPGAILNDSDFAYGNIVAFIRNHVQREAKVLDVGCGNGTLSIFMASQGCTVTALDISNQAVMQATMGAKNLGVAGITFVPVDFAEFSTDDTFDAILCLDVLEHIPDDNAAIAKMAGLLKPGGIVVIRVPSPRAFLHRFRLAVFDQDVFDRSVGHLRRYAPKELVSKLSAHGFRTLEIQPVEGVLRNFLFTTRRGNRLLRFAARPQTAPLVTAADRVAMRLLGDSGFNLVAVLDFSRIGAGG